MTNPVPSTVPGVRVLLMGESGMGKTHAIRTILEMQDAPIKDVFVFYTEPGMEILADKPHDNPDGPNYHWQYIKPTAAGTETLMEQARKMASMSWEGLQKKTDDPQKKKYDAGARLLEALHEPTCEECGAKFDDVSHWTNEQVVVLDSLSGLNDAAMQLVAGGSLVKSQPQWGAAMGFEMQVIKQLCYDTNAHFIMTAHLDKQIDEIQGGQIVRVNALGNKNAPEVPKNFSDVILCYRDGPKFFWSAASARVETKARNLPLREDNKPDFSSILSNWRSKYERKLNSSSSASE